MKREIRNLPVEIQPIEIREDEDGNKEIRGYAAVFYDGTPATEFSLYDDLIERIDREAFADVLEDDVRALFNHDKNIVLGRTTAGTARIFVDSTGLGYAITPPDSRADVMESVDRGDIDGSSFSFSVWGDGGETDYITEGDHRVRLIKRVSDLFDVGPVTFPAYEGTTSYARDLENVKAEIAEIEKRRIEENAKNTTVGRDRAMARARVISLDIESENM